ncbi:MAG: 30S ribosomal protein S6 [Patescibacteria group bacterium]
MERNYEVVIILKEVVGAPMEKAKKAVGEVFKGLEVNVLGEDDWGKRALAYDIQGKKEGYYLFYTLKMAPEKVKQLRGKFEVNDDLLRFLIFTKD